MKRRADGPSHSDGAPTAIEGVDLPGPETLDATSLILSGLTSVGVPLEEAVATLKDSPVDLVVGSVFRLEENPFTCMRALYAFASALEPSRLTELGRVVLGGYGVNPVSLVLNSYNRDGGSAGMRMAEGLGVAPWLMDSIGVDGNYPEDPFFLRADLRRWDQAIRERPIEGRLIVDRMKLLGGRGLVLTGGQVDVRQFVEIGDCQDVVVQGLNTLGWYLECNSCANLTIQGLKRISGSLITHDVDGLDLPDLERIGHILSVQGSSKIRLNRLRSIGTMIKVATSAYHAPLLEEIGGRGVDDRQRGGA